MGVPIDGLPVVGFTHMRDQSDFRANFLGHRPPGKDVDASNNTAVLCGLRVKARWLESQFSNLVSVDTTDLLVQQYAQFYILEMLGGMLFMDKSGEQLLIIYPQFFNPISNEKNFSQGNVALSWLYRHLCYASEKTAKQIGGALLLVQFWAWARFPHICHVMRHPHQALPPSPLAVRYVGSQIVTILHFCINFFA